MHSFRSWSTRELNEGDTADRPTDNFIGYIIRQKLAELKWRSWYHRWYRPMIPIATMANDLAKRKQYMQTGDTGDFRNERNDEGRH